MTDPQRACAIGAHPMGAPGWPDLAFCTISAESRRMVFTHRLLIPSLVARVAIFAFFEGGSEDIR